MATRHPYLQLEYPMVLAHRGDSAHAPANTEPAFRKAVECGADALETDIHWTKDGEIVVCHDDTVDAVSDGTGAIKDMTLAELKELDFGYSFTNDAGTTFPYRGKGIHIMTLEELLRTFPSMRVNMDVKPKEPPSVRQLIQVIHDCQAEWRVLLASFHALPLQTIRSLSPRLATSATTSEVARFWLQVKLGFNPFGKKRPYLALQVPNRINRLSVATKNFIDAAHTAFQTVHVWTVDDPGEMKRLLKLGVDGVVTNDPTLAIQVREQGSGMEWHRAGI